MADSEISEIDTSHSKKIIFRQDGARLCANHGKQPRYPQETLRSVKNIPRVYAKLLDVIRDDAR